MDSHLEIAEFARHHKCLANQLLHIFSALIFMSIILYLSGGYGAVVIYCILVYVMVPDLTLLVIMASLLLYSQYALKALLPRKSKRGRELMYILLPLLVVSYMLPELGHRMTSDKTNVLPAFTIHHVTRNVMTLLPYSLCAVMRSRE